MHVQVAVAHSFSLLPTVPLSKLPYFIYLCTAEGHLHSCQFATITNSSTMNILVHDFWCIDKNISGRYTPRFGISGRGMTMLTLGDTSELFFKRAVPIYPFTSVCESSSCSHPHQHLILSVFSLLAILM